MRNISSSMVAMVLTILMAGPALATNVPVYFDAGTTNYIGAVVDYPTTGAGMAGMTVQVSFANGTSETETWISTGTASGAASGTGWSLAQSGDTFPYESSDGSLAGYWTLTSNPGSLAISQVRIDALAGNTVFDTNDNAEGTPGSWYGYDFTLNPDYSPNFDISGISATYQDAVAIMGSSPVGDLYRYLDIDFGNDFGPGSSLEFFADTDTDAATPLGNVPLPGTFLLLGSGLLGLVGLRRIRKG
jgi:hypothetical protein